MLETPDRITTIENKEVSFHDKWAEQTDLDDIYVKESFESESSPENKQILRWMGNIEGKKILELGCGLGEASTYFASKGAIVTASDISPEMLKKAEALAHRHNTSFATSIASANDISAFPDETFDIIYAANLLHHVHIKSCIDEIVKKLRPGGRAFFWDPIKYNPAINVYRRIATKVRTDDEHPLGISDLRYIKKQFSEVELKFFWFTSLYIFLKYFFIDRVDPNQERYWKKILKDSDTLNGTIRLTNKIDQFLFEVIPGLKYLAWNVAINARK